jgi:hypothetical protein
VKEISTVAKRGTEIFKQQQLTIGLDLGDPTSRMKKNSPRLPREANRVPSLLYSPCRKWPHSSFSSPRTLPTNHFPCNLKQQLAVSVV